MSNGRTVATLRSLTGRLAFSRAGSLTTLQPPKNALYWGSGVKSGWEDMQRDCSSVGGVLD